MTTGRDLPHLTPTYYPNDPLFPQLWHHANTGNNPGTPGGTPGADLYSPWAWGLQHGGILVGNPDTSIEWWHEDLVDNVWRNLGEDADGDGDVLEWDALAGRFVFDPGDLNGADDDANGYVDDVIGWDFLDQDNDPRPDTEMNNFHGTATAGALIGRGDNGRGITGMCWRCSLIATRGIGDPRALEYLVDQGAQAVSLSFHGQLFGLMGDLLEYGATLGVVYVAAAGNGRGIANNGLCTSENVACVTATTSYDRLAFFSDYGALTDVGAPGTILTTGLGGAYQWQSGTSLSTPLVAGVAALLLAHHPGLTSQEVLAILQTATDPFASSITYGGTGRVNALRSVQLADTAATVGSFPVALLDAVRSRQDDWTLNVVGTATSPEFSHYEVRIGPGPYPSSSAVLYTGQAPVVDDVLFAWDLASVPFGVDYQVDLRVVDTHGQVALDNLYPLRKSIPYLAGWPQSLGASIRAAPVLGDLDGDGTSEIVVATTQNQVFALSADGYVRPGWPTSAFTNGVAPALADLDGQPGLEIVIGNGPIRAWRADGSIVPGWPVSLQGAAPAAAADLDGDGTLEIVAGSQYGGVTLWYGHGTRIPGWPQSTGAIIGASPVFGDLGGSSAPEIVIGSGTPHHVYAWHLDGTSVAGWPVAVGAAVKAPAALGDVDRDGLLDVIVGATDRYVYVWHHDGTAVPGWPQQMGGAPTAPALGDLDGDQTLDIVIGSTDSRVYAWRADGSRLAGWPRVTQGQILGSPVLGDLDGDGRLEVVAGSTDGWVYAWHADGSAVDGWPSQTGSGIVGAPALGDLDGDGTIEILVGALDGFLYAWTTGPDTGPAGWPLSGRNPAHSGLFPQCPDKTNAGGCARTRPSYCTATVELVANCRLCGCESGFTCRTDGTCLRQTSSPIYVKRIVLAS